MTEKIIPKSKDIAAWYNDVVLRAELADYSPVKGMMVFRPEGFAIWEHIQSVVDRGIKARGVRNAYFPILIPESYLQKEKEHVKGFSPQVAVVTEAGGKKLAEPLVVRPTSETIMYELFSKWIHSYRDLPLLLNQWGSVVRWELRTYLFMRTSEFLWQEGHTAHTSESEADNFARDIISMYEKDLITSDLAMPLISGRKSDSDKFAGAQTTYTMEALMPDGKALQLGTAHNLGQNFAKPFKVTFLDEKGKTQYVWQTSWAVSSRLIGALVLVHGDDRGLVLPPRLAQIQVVVVPIGKKADAEAKKVAAELTKSGLHVRLDDRDEYTPGWKFNEWELKGIPIRCEIGEREVSEKSATLVRRDTGVKIKVQRSKIESGVQKLLGEIQRSLFTKAKKFMDENTRPAKNMKEFEEIMEKHRGFIRAYWCGDAKEEAQVKAKTKATTRVLPFADENKKGRCVVCGKPAKGLWIWGLSY
jgi:prolyl-tRNA synthetase